MLLWGEPTILVGGDWNMTTLFFHSVGNVIIPIDERIFFTGVAQPPTSIKTGDLPRLHLLRLCEIDDD